MVKIDKIGNSSGFVVRANTNDPHMLDLCTVHKGKCFVWATVSSDFIEECGVETAYSVAWECLPEDSSRIKEYTFQLILSDYTVT